MNKVLFLLLSPSEFVVFFILYNFLQIKITKISCLYPTFPYSFLASQTVHSKTWVPPPCNQIKHPTIAHKIKNHHNWTSTPPIYRGLPKPIPQAIMQQTFHIHKKQQLKQKKTNKHPDNTRFWFRSRSSSKIRRHEGLGFSVDEEWASTVAGARPTCS